MSAMTKEIDAIEATLRRLQEKHGPKAEKILKRGKDGEPKIEYFKQGRSHHFDAAKAELARTSTFVPVLPLPHENGTKVALPNASEAQAAARPSVPKGEAPSAVAAPEVAATEVRELTALVGLSFHEAPRGAAPSPAESPHSPCRRGAGGEGEDDNPLADLIRRAQAQAALCSRRPGFGRPVALDERGKGQLLGLLAVGLSLRQAAAILGVSHTTLRRTLAANAELSDEINAARSRAALEPLACVIRESKRSWRAATWLLKYLDGKLKDRDYTPDETDRKLEEEHEAFKRANKIK